MSKQDQALEDVKRKKPEEKIGILEVFVRRAGFPRLSHGTITLTNDVVIVRWSSASLAQGEQLQIHFLQVPQDRQAPQTSQDPQEPEGPFAALYERNWCEVVGAGHRGPDALKEYTYEVRILGPQGEVTVIGTGRVINEATKKIPVWIGGLGEPPPDPLGWK